MTSWWGRSRTKAETTSKHLRGLREGYGEDEEEDRDKRGYVPTTAFASPLNPNSENAPLLLRKMVGYLSSRAVGCNGLFSRSVPQKDVHSLREKIMAEGEGGVKLESVKNPFVVGEVFKGYLAALPEPLLTHSSYDLFVSVSDILDPKIQLSMLR